MVVIAVIMLVMIRLLSDAAVEYDIKQELRKSVDNNAQFVDVEQDEVIISDRFLYQDEDIHFLVIQRRGEIVAGEYPEDIVSELKNLPIQINSSRNVVCHGEKYCVRDVRVGRSRDKGVYVRGIVKKKDAYSRYRTIEQVSYFCMIGVFLIIFICEMLLSKKISKELKHMCETAESIGTNLDMSRRMEYDGRFREIAVLAQANNRMLDRMEETFRLQEQFTSDVAHELRTPVAVMLAQCQYAEGKLDSQEEFREFLDVVNRQSGKIHAIIHQLLRFSRLDQDREQLHLEQIDLRDIVEVVCEEQQEKAGDAVVITCQLQKAVTMGDIHLITIVVQNLISNAVKFSYAKGKVEVSTGEDTSGVYVAVTDHGIGIEKEELPYIFRRFYKCDKSRNREGVGLGLSLSMKIAEKHGGRIQVESEIGQGSRFTLFLQKI